MKRFALFVSMLSLILPLGCGSSDNPDGPVPLPGLEQVTDFWSSYPVLSPDGKWLAFCSQAGIVRMSLTGGPLDTLLGYGTEPDWSPDGSLILYWVRDQYAGKRLGTVNVNTKEAEHICTDCLFDGPKWAPRGDSIVATGSGINGLVIISYFGGDVSQVSCHTPGSGVPGVCDGEMPTWSPDGEWIAFVCPPGIVKTRGVGDTAATVIEATDVIHPAWSPNGKWIAFSMDDSSGSVYSIWVVDARGENFGLWRVTSADTTLTGTPCWDLWPRWSPDSRLIYFMSTRFKQDFAEYDIWRIGFKVPSD